MEADVRRGSSSAARAPWAGIQWLGIAATGALAMVLGYLGFDAHPDYAGRPWLDKAYLALQLFGLESGAVDPPPPDVALNVARFLAPLTTAWALVILGLVLFRDRIRAARVRWFARDHVVVCGLGRTGTLITLAFLARGQRVVVLERDPTNPAIDECRRAGATVVLGDAADRSLLAEARADRAAHVFAVAGDDASNAGILSALRVIAGSAQKRPITCYVRVMDPDLINLLAAEFAADRRGRLRIEPFNPTERAVPVLLNEHPPFDDEGETSLGSPHLLIVGLGETGGRILLEAARRWRAVPQAQDERLPITVIDRDAAVRLDGLQLQDPAIADTCDIACHEVDAASPLFERSGNLLDSADGPPTAAYVALGDDSLALSTALRLRRRFRRLRSSPTPIVVRAKRQGGLDTLLVHLRAANELHVFDLLELISKPEVLIGGRTERLAQAIHAAYLRQQSAEGRSVRDNPSMRNWDDLPEDLRESNRQQADDIGRKLRAIGCVIEATSTDSDSAFAFSPLELELLAQMEHERWVHERESQGWRPGPEKDVERRVSPYLVPWRDLPDQVRELDRETVRGIPRFLADAGLRIVRVSESHSAPG